MVIMDYKDAGREHLDPYFEELEGSEFHYAIGSGSWVKVNRTFITTDNYYGYFYPMNQHFTFPTCASDAWVDGMYVNDWEYYVPGESFEDHPTSSVILPDMTFTDAYGKTYTLAVRFDYDKSLGKWSAASYYGDNAPDEFFLDESDVKALIEKSKYKIPESGYVYNGFQPCGTPFTTTKHVTSLDLPDKFDLPYGRQRDLVAVVKPDDASHPMVQWQIRPAGMVDASVYVSQNKQTLHLQGLKEGTCQITAISEDGGISKTCEVTIKRFGVEAIKITNGDFTMNPYDDVKLQTEFIPDYADDKTVTYVSSDPSVVSIYEEDGDYHAFAINPGKATITATTNNGKTATCVITVGRSAACREFGFCPYNGKKYWYEHWTKQGIYGDPKNITDELYGIERGREIYDPESNGWYWLDAVFDGAAACGKEVWMPYVYQDEKKWDDDEIRKNANEADEGMIEFCYQCMKEGTGKWVRYDENGAMLKGWVPIEGKFAELYPEQKGNVYYYDNFTGLMAKGWLTIDGVLHHFHETTGVLLQ